MIFNAQMKVQLYSSVWLGMIWVSFGEMRRKEEMPMDRQSQTEQPFAFHAEARTPIVTQYAYHQPDCTIFTNTFR